jgi:photosystem I subunit XI
MASNSATEDRTYPKFQDRTFRQVVHPGGDPQNGNFATPINASKPSRSFLQILPAYREGLTPFRRALEVGIVHGLFIVIPFIKLGPLRDTSAHLGAGFLSSLGLILISAITIWLYASSNPPPPLPHVTGQKTTGLVSRKDWNQYALGFLVGGISGSTLTTLFLWIGEHF